METLLTDRIRELTPKLVNGRLITRNKRLGQFDYEAERKFGLSKYWGYSYQDYRQSRNPETHYRNCLDSLKSMEAQLRELFSDFQVQTDERKDVSFQKLWTEEATLPLFEESYKKGFLAYVLSPFKQLTGNILRALKQEHQDFCFNMNDLSGMSRDLDPKTERLLILKSQRIGEAVFSVCPDRYFTRCYERMGMEVCDKGQRILGYQHLPILLKLKGFDSGDRRFRDLHERLVLMDFNPLKREFPFVPTQSDINLDKFNHLVHQYAQKGEYAKSYSARNTIENALRKGVLTFEEAEILLPRVLKGEIVFESQVIKDLCSNLREN